MISACVLLVFARCGMWSGARDAKNNLKKLQQNAVFDKGLFGGWRGEW